jgi:alcohol dehydrogenase (cytochrome c)
VPLDPRQALGLKVRPGADHYGEVQAWDPTRERRSGRTISQNRSCLVRSQRLQASSSSPAGPTTGSFRAFDAKTGELLWEQKTNSGIVGMPVAYEVVDGTEYIAIQSGWGVDAQRI